MFPKPVRRLIPKRNLINRPPATVAAVGTKAPATTGPVDLHLRSLDSMQRYTRDIVDALELVAHLATRRSFQFGGDASAGATLTLPLFAVDVPAVVFDVAYAPGAGLTASGTNYATIKLTYDDGSGGQTGIAKTTFASISTTPATAGGSGNWTTGVAVSIPFVGLDVTQWIVPAGQQITLSITKTGAGVVVPSGSLWLSIGPAILSDSKIR